MGSGMASAEGEDRAGKPVLRIAGDMGLLVEFGDAYAPAISNAVLAFDAALRQMALAGVIETVPTFRSVLVRFDPLELSFDRLEARLGELLAGRDWYLAPPPQGRCEWVLPAVYGGASGPDLAEVADLAGLREDQVAEAHAAEPLTVAMLGFSPGLAYLGQLARNWNIARRTGIIPEVPAGAVLVAVRQTVLPATPIPTGWRQIARTPFRGFDPRRQPPFLLSPGDLVRFEPVSEAKIADFDMDQFVRGKP